MAEHAAQARGKTTGAVCCEVVKPATRERRCAYVELLRGRSRGGVPAVARATVFLSHAWGNPLEGLVDAAEARLGGEAGTAYVWLDILTVNQHNRTCESSGCACGSPRALPPQSWWSGAISLAPACRCMLAPAYNRVDCASFSSRICVLHVCMPYLPFHIACQP